MSEVPCGTSVKRVLATIGVLFGLYEICVNVYGLVPAVERNAVHLLFALAIVFLTKPTWQGPSVSPRARALDRAVSSFLVFLSVLVIAYVVFAMGEIDVRGPIPLLRDQVFAVICIIVLLEATRRVTGIPLVILALVLLLYTGFGHYIPGMFGHAMIPWRRILFRMFLSGEGIWGTALSVSATFIYIFILFGALLDVSGGSRFFTDLATAATGRFRSGPAQVAVVSSALMGTISGSAAANVVTTGSVTIPMMRSLGYPPEVAGAVEAAASTGGMIMPPVMGATAFVMASFLGLPYWAVCVAAALPAVLYYVTVGFSVELVVRKLRIPPPPAPQEGSSVRVLRTLRERGHLLVPIVAIVWALAVGKSPMFAAFSGIVSLIVVAALRRESRLGLRTLIEALCHASLEAVQIACVCATAGIIVSATTMTGLGITLGENVLALVGDNLFLVLFAFMALSLILSMGLPATALYIVVISVLGPALAQMNVSALAGHMFVFWYGVMGNLTPPVAIASYAAAALSGGRLWPLSFVALKLAAGGMILPFMFVFNPALLLQGVSLLTALRVSVTALTGALCLAVAVQGYLLRRASWFERLLFLGAAFLLIDPGALTDVFGLILAGVGVALQRLLGLSAPHRQSLPSATR